MTSDPRRPDRAALEALLARLDPDARLLGHAPLEGGVSATMIALDVVRGSGVADRLILRLPGPENLKVDPRVATHEALVLDHVTRHGLPAPVPLLLDSSREIVGLDAVLLGWIEGEPDFDPLDRATAGRDLADLLVRLHGLPRDPRLDVLPHAGDPVDRLDEPVAPGHPVTLDALTAAGLDLVHDRLPANPQVLLHGDPWPGNLLWRGTELVGLLDWEDACRGDPLCDLAIARLDLAIFWGPEAVAAFTTRYLERSGIAADALPLWDLVAARRAPVDYADWAQGWDELGRPDITAAAMERARRLFAADAFARLADWMASGPA